MRRNLILVVEDDPTLGETLVEIFKNEGYSTLLATNGENALSLFSDVAFKPSLLLVDLHLPLMNGQTFLKKLRSKTSVIPPVLFMTAAGETDLAEKVLDPIIYKPFDLDELIQKVEALASPDVSHGVV